MELDFGKVLGLAVVGVGGYVAYKQVVDPWLEQRRVMAEARAVASRTGVSYQDALAAVSQAACLAAVKAKGGPLDSPLVQQGCKLAGSIAALAILKGGPLAIKGVKMGVQETIDLGSKGAHLVVGGVSAVGSGIVGGASAVGSGVISGAKAVGSAASSVGSAAKSTLKKVVPFWGLDDELAGLLGYAA